MAQKRCVERLRLDFVPGKPCPVFRERLDEPGHSESGENAFWRDIFAEAIGEFGDSWNQPSLVLGLRRPDEDRVVAQRPINARQDKIKGGGVFCGVGCPDSQPERMGIFRNGVTREAQPAVNVTRSCQSTPRFLLQSLQGVSKNNIGR